MSGAATETGADRPVTRRVARMREGLRSRREQSVLDRADPRFAAALEPALQIEGYTAPTELALLYHLGIAATGPGTTVEIGSYLGRSTVVLARAAIDAGRDPIAAVDPHTSALGIEGEQPRDTREEFLANCEQAGVSSHVRLLHMKSVDAAREWEGEPVRLLFVDGWHSKEAVLQDVHAWAPFLTPDSAIVFDDFLPFAGVRAAVRDLKAEGTVRGSAAIVGKMAAFGPAEIMRQVPVPAGGRALARLNDRALDLAIRVLAT
jgi:MMP 1-O-methyltransferase